MSRTSETTYDCTEKLVLSKFHAGRVRLSENLLESIVLYCNVLYCTALYCTTLHCTVLYCTVELRQTVHDSNPQTVVVDCQSRSARGRLVSGTSMFQIRSADEQE
eukprot:COSAG05_NODE_48_length_24425_cov_90.438543_22_plen_105_part_00